MSSLLVEALSGVPSLTISPSEDVKPLLIDKANCRGGQKPLGRAQGF